MRMTCLTAAIFAAAFAVSPATAGDSVPIDQLDATVVEAIKSKFQDAELLSASRETDDGTVKHEVKIRHQGEVWEIDVAENGEITEMEREDKR